MAAYQLFFYPAAVLCALAATLHASTALAQEAPDPLVAKLERAASCAARGTSSVAKCECSTTDEEFQSAMHELELLKPEVSGPALAEAKKRNVVPTRESDPEHKKLCTYFGLLDIEKRINKERKSRFCSDAVPSLKDEGFQRANTAWCNSWIPVLEQATADAGAAPTYRSYAGAQLLAHGQLGADRLSVLREGRPDGIPILARIPPDLACGMLTGAKNQYGLQKQSNGASAEDFSKLAAELEELLKKLEIDCSSKIPVPHGKKTNKGE